MAVSVNYAIADWQDSIQSGSDPVETASGNSTGWGFTQCWTEGGGTLVRVTDPLNSGRLCIQHQLDLNQAQNRAQCTLYGSPWNAWLTHANGCWVAIQMMFPEEVNPETGAVFISINDFHSLLSPNTDRWDTRPGWMLYRQSNNANNMKLWDAWHGTENPQDYDSNLSATALPIGSWFWFETYYRWSATEYQQPVYVDGVLFHQSTQRMTQNGTTHDSAQVSTKWYGGGPWTPMTPIKYTGEMLLSTQGQMVTVATGGSILSGARPLFRHIGLLR